MIAAAIGPSAGTAPGVEEEECVIATVRRQLFSIEVITRYRPRTAVERWQIQDRLGVRLRRLGCEARPRFYETADGRLGFRLRPGWGIPPTVLRRLGDVDLVTAGE